MQEIICWKSIEDYEGYYEINSIGEVKSVERIISCKTGFRKIVERTLSTRTNNCGYKEVRLSKNSKTKTSFIHVLLAKAFIENPENKPQINHINGIKNDNNLTNLEWVTHQENMKHAYKLGLQIPNSKKVIDICTGSLFESIAQAANYLNISYSNCKNMLNGNRNNLTNLRLLLS